MAAELHVLSGNRAGLVLPLDGAECAVGRHPACALRFGADTDPGVSARHARLVPHGAGWLLRDLGSTNGTWLNGRRVREDTPLRDGDRFALGLAGPVVEFRLAGTRAAPAPLPAARRRGPRGPRGAWTLAASASALVVAAAAGVLATRRAAPRPAGDALEPIPAEAVGTFRVAAAAPPHAPIVTPPERSARPASRPARRAGPTTAPPPHPPEPQVEAAAAAAAAPVRVPVVITVERRNRNAVARIYVEGEDGEVSTGTAFAVRGDGTLVTNRHVLGRPGRIAVQFAGSSQVWPARVVAVSGEWDLAVVKVDLEDEVPTVAGLNLRPDTLAEGAPVALVGFPRAGEPVEGATIRPFVLPAALARVRTDRVEVFARSSGGASGSPVLDAQGRVIGVLYGGSPGAAQPVLYAVPARAIVGMIGGG